MASDRPGADSLADVLDRILDKGVVIDIWARISVVGIEILTVEARVVVASVDTFLHYAAEISKIEEVTQEGGLEDLRDLEIRRTPATQAQYPEAT